MAERKGPGWPDEVQTVSAADLPLPSGAATAAKQDTGNTSLGTINTSLVSVDGKTPALSGGKVPVVFTTPVSIVPAHATRADTYTTTASGVTVDSSAVPLQHYGIQVKGTGAAPTSWTALLEGSLDGTNFSTLITHNANDGSILWLIGGVNLPCLYMRSRVSALSLGSATNIVVTIIGVS